MPTVTQKKPRPLTAETYTLKMREGQKSQLQDLEYSTGVPVPEQIRRGIDLWIAKQGKVA